MLAAATASKARVLVVASHWTQNYEAFWPESDKTVVVRDGETRLEVSLRILADANPAKKILFIGQVPGSHYDYRACLADASAPLARRWKSCPSSTRNSYPWVGDREQMNRMVRKGGEGGGARHTTRHSRDHLCCPLLTLSRQRCLHSPDLHRCDDATPRRSV